MSDTLTATRRETTGSRAAQKLRAEGIVPAVLYGHKEASVSLSLQAKELRKALAHKAKVVKLTGDVDEQALVQAIQWDTFHRHLMHIDLLRVSKGEKVQVTVPIELKGEAPGAIEGGVVTTVLDHVEIEAAPISIPEVLHIDISALNLGENVTAEQITDLPDGAELLTDTETVLVQCVPPAGEPALDGVAEEGGEPEVVGDEKDEKKEEDDAE